MEDKIKNSEIWQNLLTNPKFKQAYEECVKRYSYYINPSDLRYRVTEDKFIIGYNSKIKSSDLGCQYRLFEQIEFFLDDKSNLIINGLSGRFETEKGNKFKNTNGGTINTHYSCNVYDPDGIELSFSRYDDRYDFDKIEYNSFMDDFKSVILGACNPMLSSSANNKGVYPYPKVIGKASQFIRQIRSIDNLGLVEVTKWSFNRDNRICDKEYYFNVLLTNQDRYTPELIHIMSGEPFAILNENSIIEISEQYSDLGLTKDNYGLIAEERFLKELKEGKKDLYYVDDIIVKYDILIDKIESKRHIKGRTKLNW